MKTASGFRVNGQVFFFCPRARRRHPDSASRLRRTRVPSRLLDQKRDSISRGSATGLRRRHTGRSEPGPASSITAMASQGFLALRRWQGLDHGATKTRGERKLRPAGRCNHRNRHNGKRDQLNAFDSWQCPTAQPALLPAEHWYVLRMLMLTRTVTALVTLGPCLILLACVLRMCPPGPSIQPGVLLEDHIKPCGVWLDYFPAATKPAESQSDRRLGVCGLPPCCHVQDGLAFKEFAVFVLGCRLMSSAPAHSPDAGGELTAGLL